MFTRHHALFGNQMQISEINNDAHSAEECASSLKIGILQNRIVLTTRSLFLFFFFIIRSVDQCIFEKSRQVPSDNYWKLHKPP
jgi:hypothetical protein